MSQVITCPSGLQGRVRGMKVREERVLADRKLARGGGQVEALLSACWEETLEPGPYAFEGGRADWSQVLQGDRFYALLRVRAFTYGPLYAFSVACREEGCRATIEWELDLFDLPVRPLSEASRAAFAAGNRFETRLPEDGRRVWFRLLTGADEQRLATASRGAGDRAFSAMLALRVLELEGVDPQGKRRALEDLSLRDADFLLGEFDRVDCGVDTAIEVECPRCLATQEVELPFDRTFFLPGTAKAARRKASRASSPT
jgi:hypothetical protein